MKQLIKHYNSIRYVSKSELDKIREYSILVNQYSMDELNLALSNEKALYNFCIENEMVRQCADHHKRIKEIEFHILEMFR